MKYKKTKKVNSRVWGEGGGGNQISVNGRGLNIFYPEGEPILTILV